MFTLKTGSDCYLLTSTGRMMPGTVSGIDGRGLVAVAAPGGRVYTCNPNNVFDREAGAIMLMHSRAEKMAAEGYEIKVRFDRTFRVFQAKRHGANGGWIVTMTDDSLTCNCPPHAKSHTCKHVMAVCSLPLSPRRSPPRCRENPGSDPLHQHGARDLPRGLERAGRGLRLPPSKEMNDHGRTLEKLLPG